MKRILASLLLVAFAFGCESMNKEPGKDNALSGDTRRDVLAGINQYLAALKNKDAATLDRLWGDDLIFINARGQTQTKADRMADIKSGATVVKVVDMTEESVRPWCKGAIATSRIHLEGTYSGKPTSGDYRTVMLWTHNGDAWQISLIQLTPIVQ